MSKHAVQTWCGYSQKMYINAFFPHSPKHPSVFRTSSVSESKDVRVGLFALFLNYYLKIKNKLGRYSVPPPHLSSACDTCGRLDGEGKCACHRRRRAIRAKNPHNGHEIQTLQWFNSTKIVHIYLNLRWRILQLKHDKCNNNNNNKKKNPGKQQKHRWNLRKPYRVQTRWDRSRRVSKSTRLEHAFIKTFKRALLGVKSSLERKGKKGLFKC